MNMPFFMGEGEASLFDNALPKAFDHRSHKHVPAIDQHKEDDLEWQGDNDRRQHHHPHGHENGCHDHINDQKGDEQKEADLEGLAQLADDEGRDQGFKRHIVRVDLWFFLRDPEEEVQIFVADMLHHKALKWLNRAFKRGDFFQVSFHVGLETLIIGLLKRWHHDEEGQKQREGDHDLVGWGLLRSKGRS